MLVFKLKGLGFKPTRGHLPLSYSIIIFMIIMILLAGKWTQMPRWSELKTAKGSRDFFHRWRRCRVVWCWSRRLYTMRTRGDLYKRFEDPNSLLILIPNSLLYLYKLKSLQIQILIWSLLSNALWYIYDLNGLMMYMYIVLWILIPNALLYMNCIEIMIKGVTKIKNLVNNFLFPF